MPHSLKLFSYWRSSASFRVRIALNLKGLRYETLPINLLQGENASAEFCERNPQRMVPVLMHGERVIRQSLAIIEWLEEHFEDTGKPLLPAAARERARVRAISYVVASDIAPLNVPRVLNKLSQDFSADEAYKKAWMLHWMREGFESIEALLDSASTGSFCEGDEPSIADCCLIPQAYNALRWGLDLAAFPSIARIYQHAMGTPEFAAAAPESQVDAV